MKYSHSNNKKGFEYLLKGNPQEIEIDKNKIVNNLSTAASSFRTGVVHHVIESEKYAD